MPMFHDPILLLQYSMAFGFKIVNVSDSPMQKLMAKVVNENAEDFISNDLP